MQKLEKTDEGRWSYGSRVLQPGDPIQLLLEGQWTSGHMEEDPDRGDYFVSATGEAHMLGLEGTLAREPVPLSPQEDYDLALSEFMIAAGAAVLALTAIGQQITESGHRPLRTANRLKIALYRLRTLRGEAVPAGF